MGLVKRVIELPKATFDVQPLGQSPDITHRIRVYRELQRQGLSLEEVQLLIRDGWELDQYEITEEASEEISMVSTKGLTFGEERVNLTFNPSGDEVVDYIKAQTAHLIDYCEAWVKDKDPRLAALAETAYEQAAMWAVKAATGETGTDTSNETSSIILVPTPTAP